MKSLMVLVCFTVGASSQIHGGEVVVGVPDGAPVSITLGIGFDVESLELLQFDGERLELIARSGSGAGSLIRMVIRDGRVSLDVMGAPGDGGPTPPGPVIPPDVDPVVPQGHLGFTRAVWQWASETVDPEADSDRVRHAREQAANYAAVAAGLVSVPPKWATVAEAFSALRKKNRAIVTDGPIRDAWAAFSGRVSDKIEGYWPFSMGEASEILKAIGAGLEAVK